MGAPDLAPALFIAIGAQVFATVAYAVLVWHPHRVKGSGLFLIALFLMAWRRTAGWVSRELDPGLLATAVNGLDDALPLAISALIAWGAWGIGHDLDRTRKSIGKLQDRLERGAQGDSR